jgi:hypothetical protein
MNHPTSLNFFPFGNALISNFEALDAGTVRYVGRRFDRDLKGFPPTGQAESVKPLHEYVLAAQRGDLIPADQETADYCGCEFYSTAIQVA